MAKTKRQVKLSAAARRLLMFGGNARTIDAAATAVVSRLIAGIPCPPTDLDALASRVGVTDVCAEKLLVSGELRRSNNSFRIVYSSSLTLPRRRFTIAHEIGHAILELTGRNCPRRGAEVERICDVLASEILMPSEIFSKAANGEASAEKIIELTETFKASISAVCIRYAKLKNVSIFRAVNGQITWHTGLVRYDPIHVDTSELKAVLSKSAERSRGADIIWMNTRTWTGQWAVSWASLGQQRLIVTSPLYEVAKRSMIAQRAHIADSTKRPKLLKKAESPREF
jgi:IrrE N-terminal-like domain